MRGQLRNRAFYPVIAVNAGYFLRKIAGTFDIYPDGRRHDGFFGFIVSKIKPLQTLYLLRLRYICPQKIIYPFRIELKALRFLDSGVYVDNVFHNLAAAQKLHQLQRPIQSIFRVFRVKAFFKSCA